MTPADWQERLASWIGSAVQVHTRPGVVFLGTITSVLRGIVLQLRDSTTHEIPFLMIEAVWVQVALEEG